MKGGIVGKLLWVDLSKGAIETMKPDPELYRRFLGGYGLGARLIYERQKPKLPPFDPANILGFATGPLTGTPAISSSRYTVMGKSPLTGTWGDANSGGFFGPAMKKAGYDGVFFEGMAGSWKYLFIADGKAELRDAGPYVGLDSSQLEDRIKDELGPDIRIACIGPAGERLSRMAGIFTDGVHARAAGRGGLGVPAAAEAVQPGAHPGTIHCCLRRTRPVQRRAGSADPSGQTREA